MTMSETASHTNKERSARSHVVSMARYEEAVDHITKLENDIQQLCREKDYLTSFIKWAGLREQYLFFRQNAREAGSPDLPFSWLECIPYPGAEPESGDSTLDA